MLDHPVSKHLEFPSNHQKYTSYKVNQKQICNAHISTHDVVVLPAIISSTVILPHADAITVQANLICHHIKRTHPNAVTN